MQAEEVARELFRASPAVPATHQEWVLRLCAQLMEREARVVSVLEQRARATSETWTSPDSDACTPQCAATVSRSWGES